jgi:hypothetical protein
MSRITSGVFSVDSHVSNYAKGMVMLSVQNGLDTYLATQLPHGSRSLEPGELTTISLMLPRYSKSASFFFTRPLGRIDARQARPGFLFSRLRSQIT